MINREIEPVMIPVRIVEFQDAYERSGFRTKSLSCNPVHVIYWETPGVEKYSFEAWEAGRGRYSIKPGNPISTEEDARNFAESKLRSMVKPK